MVVPLMACPLHIGVLMVFTPLVSLRPLDGDYHAVLTHGDVLHGKVLFRVEPDAG